MIKPQASKHPLSFSDELQKELHRWFKREGKNLPWRKTKDPWAILVSEIMLQQTTVAAVISNRRFEKFLEEYPNLREIASADEAQLLKSWEGLGYYNRVRNLQKAAKAVLEKYDGLFPLSAVELEALPGIGKYTAGAVSSFAFNQPAAIVDANIARTIARLFNYEAEIDSSTGQKIIWNWAAQLLDKTKPRLFNSALMELGQTYCSPKKPNCMSCPVANFCQTTDPESLPKKKPRKTFEKIQEHAILNLRNDKILLVKEDGSRRKGFWRLPLATEDEVAHLKVISTHRYTITYHKVTVLLYEAKLYEDGEWVALSDLKTIPIATPIRRIIEGAI